MKGTLCISRSFLIVLITLTMGVHVVGIERANSQFYSEADLERYVEKWKVRDGLQGVLISDYFCEFLIQEPSCFLRTLSKHPKEFHDWVENLGALSFTDRGGCINRRCLRAMMIESLEQLEGSKVSDVKELRDHLLEVIKRTAVRSIE